MLNTPGQKYRTTNLLMHIKKGFTLVEVLIVVVIIIILAGVGVPLSADYVSSRQLYNEATQLQQDLLRVQNLAITHSTESKFPITFSSSSSYVYAVDEAGTKTTTRTLPSSVNIYDVKVDDAGVTLPVSFNFDNQGILHKVGATDTCTLEVYIQFTGGSKQIKVIVSPIGRVTIDWVKK